ncbi:MAG: family N-acetyltransferase, partial [Candidatus Hydrogenedentes bacterium]|nr:family N-acetyltransferase [Candidatus Hydrogenedentota bacterium]
MTGTEHSGALAVRGVETDDELAAANDLMAKVHCSDYFYGMNWLKSFGAGYPGYLREHTRIALWNGELAGSLRLNTETIRIGEAR